MIKCEIKRRQDERAIVTYNNEKMKVKQKNDDEGEKQKTKKGKET